ncbi:putative transmembrane protein [Toxoplasma gondii CAST]|uniref:Putative transmembrane protein n=1 Tax=Toxoplasma gondii CAST TaxID=943122 RepID=A0A3R8AKQ3_TOXGO|nr:putative transmembrane protein [Toxoplasma gondii CAST]
MSPQSLILRPLHLDLLALSLILLALNLSLSLLSPNLSRRSVNLLALMVQMSALSRRRQPLRARGLRRLIDGEPCGSPCSARVSFRRHEAPRVPKSSKRRCMQRRWRRSLATASRVPWS